MGPHTDILDMGIYDPVDRWEDKLKTAFNKMKALVDLINKHSYSQKTNLIIEIIFPLGLGVFAIGVAVWVSFAK